MNEQIISQISCNAISAYISSPTNGDARLFVRVQILYIIFYLYNTFQLYDSIVKDLIVDMIEALIYSHFKDLDVSVKILYGIIIHMIYMELYGIIIKNYSMKLS